MLSSAQKIKMSLPYSTYKIKTNLMKLVKLENILDGTIYIQVTRGNAERTHHFPKEPSPILVAYTNKLERPFNKTRNGIEAILLEDIRWSRCDIKSLNLLGNILSKQEAKDNNCEEAILYRNRIITEGSSTNVFIVKNDKLQTHPVNNFILKGVTREKIINLAQKSNFNFSDESFTIEELIDADEVFITSTTLEVVPVIKVNNSAIGDGTPGRFTRILQELFNKYIQEFSQTIP